MTSQQQKTLWELGELKEILNGEWLVNGNSNQPIVHISVTRMINIKQGSLFFALRGEFYNDIAGNLKLAFEKGASAVILSKKIQCDYDEKWSVLLVPSVNEALRKLASKARERFKDTGKVIAVTGSAGKTSTVSMLGQVLSTWGQAYYDSSNRNLLDMIAHCILETPKDNDFSVYEVGAMPTAMIETSQLVRPHIVILTGTGNSHLSYMHSQIMVADLKSQLFFAIEKKGLAIINRDDRFFNRIAEAASEFGTGQIITFGEHPLSSVRLLSYKVDLEGTDVEACVFGQLIRYRVNLSGKHWVMNSLAVLATANFLGLKVADIADSFEKMLPVSRRGDRYEFNLAGKKVTVYNESFNANPLSMRTALNMLEDLPRVASKRKVLVLGEMQALGEYGVREHVLLAKEINDSGIDKVFACGNLMQHLFAKLEEKKQGSYAKDTMNLFSILLDQLQDGDIVVIKGSRGNKMEFIVDKFKELSL